jgi:hypothetical protein
MTRTCDRGAQTRNERERRGRREEGNKDRGGQRHVQMLAASDSAQRDHDKLLRSGEKSKAQSESPSRQVGRERRAVRPAAAFQALSAWRWSRGGSVAFFLSGGLREKRPLTEFSKIPGSCRDAGEGHG